jgi:CubicO group peptidase (beta-lactamase class C family)
MVAAVAEPQITPLGKIWSYNNAGFYIAGRVIEVVAEKPFEAGLRQLVLDPLGRRRRHPCPRAGSMALMRKPHAPAMGPDQIGLTWFLRAIAGESALVHGGGTNGQVSLLVILPRAVACCRATSSYWASALRGAAGTSAQRVT